MNGIRTEVYHLGSKSTAANGGAIKINKKYVKTKNPQNLENQMHGTGGDMKTYCFLEPVFDEKKNLLDTKTIEMTEEQILSDEFGWKKHWTERMKKKFKENSPEITDKNCLDDFLIMNWAWEKKE